MTEIQRFCASLGHGITATIVIGDGEPYALVGDKKIPVAMKGNVPTLIHPTESSGASVGYKAMPVPKDNEIENWDG